jgi:hypothetical protein
MFLANVRKIAQFELETGLKSTSQIENEILRLKFLQSQPQTDDNVLKS